MNAVAAWFKGAPQKPGRLVVIALVAAYWWRVYTSAQTVGQLFNFTVIGIATGCVIAIAASGLVLTYATTGVFNFAHGAVGMIAAYAFYALSVQHGLPTPLALVLVLVVLGPLVGLLLERVMRHFHDAPIQTSVTVTIALMVMLIGIAQKLFPPTTGARLDFLFGIHTWRLWEATPTYDDVAHFVTAIAVALLLRALLFRSRTGTAMRAVVDNPGLAALNGAPPVTIARYSWMLGSTLGALAGIFLAAGGPLDPIVLTFFVTAALGAAIVGKLKSLPLTFAGAIALGVIESHALFALPTGSGWDSVRISIPGIFLFGALLLVPSARLSVGRIVGRKSPVVPTLPSSVVRAAAFVAAMVFIVNVAPGDRLVDMTTALIYAVLLLSLVMLTGFSGQISLCQYVFLAMGTWAMGTYFGGNSIFGMLLAGLVALPLGVLIALPALRLQGLYLALVTFGFAAVAEDLLLKNDHFYGSQSVHVGRLHLMGIKFDDEKAFFILCAITFAVMALGVLALRRGSFGRRLAAMRDSQAACATLGLDVRRTKLAVFAISAFMAGIAGSLFGGLKTTADAIQFSKENNIVLLLFAVVDGITTVTGALIGGSLFALLPFVQSQYPDQAGLVFAGVAIAVVALGRQPNGVAGLVYEWFSGLRPSSRARPSPASADAGDAGKAPPAKETVGAAA